MSVARYVDLSEAAQQTRAIDDKWAAMGWDVQSQMRRQIRIDWPAHFAVCEPRRLSVMRCESRISFNDYVKNPARHEIPFYFHDSETNPMSHALLLDPRFDWRIMDGRLEAWTQPPPPTGTGGGR